MNKRILAALIIAGCALCGCVNPATKLTEKQALEIGLNAIESKFPGATKENLPYTAEYSKGIWIIRGTLPANQLGGTPVASIDDDTGKVIRIRGEQ